MKEVKDGAEQQTERGREKEEEDRPPGNSLRIWSCGMQLNGLKDAGIQMIFHLFDLFLDHIDAGDIESMFHRFHNSWRHLSFKFHLRFLKLR